MLQKGVVRYCKYNQMEPKDLMYIITGQRADCPHSMVLERCINTNNVSDYNCRYSSKDTWWPDAF